VITIDLTDRATPLLLRLGSGLRSGGLEKVMERALVNKVQGHLFRLNNERANQLGGVRTNFYSQAAKSTHGSSERGRVTVTISHVGIRQRYYGGVIRPKAGKKYLTIPVAPEAHGKRAREFSNLRFGFTEGRFGGLVPALVKTSASRIRIGRQRKDGSRSVKQIGATGGEAVFILARQVFQRPDPAVLPTPAELETTALKAAQDYVDRQIRRQGGSNA
jgi:hypothetical protein